MVVAERTTLREGRRRTGRGRLTSRCRPSFTRPTRWRPARRWSGTSAPQTSSVDGDVGDKAATDAAFARAAHVVRLDTWIQRVTGVPMEPRTAIGDYDAASGRYTIYAGTGGGMVRERQMLAGVLERAGREMPRRVRRHGRQFRHAQHLLPRIRRCCRGRRARSADRSNGMATAANASSAIIRAAISPSTPSSRSTRPAISWRLRGTNLSNVGAYTAHFTPLRKGLGIMSGVYRIPAVHFRGCAVLTNTMPTTPYRSAGRPEAIYVIERLIDIAAAQCGFDRIELRRRNLIPPAAMPLHQRRRHHL